MSHHPRENNLAASVEKMYVDLLYCRADARLGDMPYVAHLLNLACEEMQRLVDAAARAVPAQADWNGFHIYPDMK